MKNSDFPHVIAPPPLIYLGGILLALLLRYVKQLEISESGGSLLLGWGFIIVSLILFISTLKLFSEAHTNVDPHKPTTSIIVNGIYHFSRNPIYASMTLFYLGITALANDYWFLIILIPILLIIQYGVIKREEEYLMSKFGEEYAKYKTSVRRWL